MIRSYCKILQYGHRYTQGLFDGPVVIQEKIDGSQISFGVYDGELKIRSRRKDLCLTAPGSLFKPSVEHIVSVQDKLVPGWTYRGEAMKASRHNILKYCCVPAGHVVLWDVDRGHCDFVSAPEELRQIALDLGLTPVRLIEVRTGPITPADIESFLSQKSQLGGVEIEGFVMKNYDKLNHEGKLLSAKIVSAKFREAHKKQSKSETQKGVLQAIINQFKTEARWEKAVQHLRESGALTGTPKDIGPLLKELQVDSAEECAIPVGEAFWEAHKKQFLRGLCGGFAEWYKAKLATEMVEEELAGAKS